MTPRWYSGQDIVNKWGVEPFELFALLKAGVQAFTHTGQKVVDSDSLPKRRRNSLESYEKRAQLEIGTERTGKVIIGRHGGGYNRPARSDDEIRQDFRRQYYSQPEDIVIVPKDCKSISFTLPDDDIGRITAISEAKTFRYLPADVDKYFDNEDKQGTLESKYLSKIGKKGCNQTEVDREKSEEQNRDSDNTQKVSAEDYIQQQRTAGEKDQVIAAKLHDKKGTFKQTYANIARLLGRNDGLNERQFDALKQRGKRLCDEGENILKNS